MNRFLTILCLLIMPAVCASVFEHPQNLATIAKLLPELSSINCKFRQEKTISSSHLILKSSGDFKFEKNKGVIFYTTYPIKSTSSYTSREYKQINSIISAITNKSYSRLERDFDFYYEGNSQNWTIGLLPKKNSQVYDYLKSIELAGNSKIITKIIILPVDLNKTTIWFN